VCSALVLDRGPACKLSTAVDDIATGSPSGLSTADGPPPRAPRAIATPITRASSGCSWPRYVLTLSHPPCCSPACAWRGSLTTWAPPYAPTANNCTLSSRSESPAPASHPRSQRVADAPTANCCCDCYALIDGFFRSLFLSSVRPRHSVPWYPQLFPVAQTRNSHATVLRLQPLPLPITLAATHSGNARRTSAPMSSTDAFAF
jgi:hypothetical protein